MVINLKIVSVGMSREAVSVGNMDDLRIIEDEEHWSENGTVGYAAIG